MSGLRSNQIDRFVDPNVLAYLGAAKTLLGKSGWYTGKAKMLIIWVMGYYQIDPVNAIVPNIYVWIVALVVFGGAVIAFEYFVMWPATIIFGNMHGEDANRSPIREDTQKILDRLDGD